MSLKHLVSEVAQLCGLEELTTKPVDLAALGVTKVHPSAESYFAYCVPDRHIDRPFFQLLSESDIMTLNRECPLSSHFIPFGFITFANEPNGDAIAIDAGDGRIRKVSHEIYTEEGILNFNDDHPIPITRKSILEHSANTFPSIAAFFVSWRDQLVDLQNNEDTFLEAALNDPNATDNSGNTLLIHFIRDGDLKMVKNEVKRGVNLELFNSEGRTALGEAVVFEYPKIVEYLIACGANVNAVNDRGQTPLMFAAMYSQLACIKILVKAGADRRATDEDDQSALEHLCVVQGTATMKKLLST